MAEKCLGGVRWCMLMTGTRRLRGLSGLSHLHFVQLRCRCFSQEGRVSHGVVLDEMACAV